MAVVETTVARVTTTDQVEAVYRQDGDRLWRALYVFSGDADIASDAEAEAFAQALRRGRAIRDVRGWVWRAAFRVAAGDLKRQSTLARGTMPDGVVHDPHVETHLLTALSQLSPQQRIVLRLFY